MQIRNTISAIIDTTLSESALSEYSKEDLTKLILDLISSNEIILRDRSDMFVRFQNLLDT